MKLTDAAKETLKALAAAPEGVLPTTKKPRPGYVSGASASSLERFGLVRRISNTWGDTRVAITDAGREVLR